MMMIGFIVSLGQVDLPFVERGIALSSVVIGAATLWSRALPSAAAAGLVGLFALFHGHAHGVEMPLAASTAVYGLGFAVSTVLLNLAGAAAAMGIARVGALADSRLPQVLGGGVALGGFGVLLGWL